MALIGPSCRNELFFFVFVFGAAALLILRNGNRLRNAKSAKERWVMRNAVWWESQNGRSQRWMIAGAIGC